MMKKLLLIFFVLVNIVYANMNQSKLDDYLKFMKVVKIIETYYVEPLTTNQIIEKLLKGGIAELDAHSSFLDKKGYKDFKVEVPITNSTLDIFSSIYNARILDYDNFSIGQTTTTKLIVDSEIETINITYRGKENIQVANSGSRSCYKLEIGFVGDGLKKAKGGKFIYITADNDRLPALIKANIPVGAVEIRLSNFSK